MQKIRWGVLSTANIGIEKVIPAMQSGKYSQIDAIASRDIRKAQSAAKQLGIPRAYGSYEDLLADSDIDAVYNPLPNHLHVPWSIKALEAEKHVLCEKPIGLTPEEAVELLDAAKKQPQLKVMEAFMYRHHPQWQKVQQLVLGGKIGTLQTIQSIFTYHNVDPGNVRNMADIGGGGLMDIGCYCISVSRFIFGVEPRRVLGVMQYDPVFKTDRLAAGLLDFEKGHATLTFSTQLAPYQQVNIFGTKGLIQSEIPFTPPPDQPRKIWYHCGDQIEEIVFDPCNQYTIQGDLFSLAILNDIKVPTPLEDAVANMKVIEAVKKSSESGNWINLL